jgi:hypothetical protein
MQFIYVLHFTPCPIALEATRYANNMTRHIEILVLSSQGVTS